MPPVCDIHFDHLRCLDAPLVFTELRKNRITEAIKGWLETKKELEVSIARNAAEKTLKARATSSSLTGCQFPKLPELLSKGH